jgi:multidrug efflux pump subunit AcrA (membrane-fusion protein)
VFGTDQRITSGPAAKNPCPNSAAPARVLLDVRRDVLVIPAPAIQRGPEGLFTWVVKPEGVVEARPITVGPSTADQTIVASGLAEGRETASSSMASTSCDSARV